MVILCSCNVRVHANNASVNLCMTGAGLWCEFPYCPLHGNGPWRAGELVRDCFCLDMCLCLTSIPHGDVACLQMQVNKDGQAVQADAALTGKVKLVLFSANNAMAKDFVFRYLAPLYGMLKSKGVFFEVVFVSEDPNEEAFKAYFAEMPRYLSDESLLVNYVTGIIIVMTDDPSNPKIHGDGVPDL